LKSIRSKPLCFKGVAFGSAIANPSARMPASRMRSEQRGFSLIELLIVVAVILAIAAIAVPNLLSARMAANEASSVASIRSINTSQVLYQSTYGAGYAPMLPDLGDGGNPANCAAPNATSACLIDSVLATGTKGGYIFTYAPTAVGAFVGQYTVNGDPKVVGSSGQRHFFSDQSLVIRFNAVAAAGPADPAI
jgi:type IV pilus assembly protein PilA